MARCVRRPFYIQQDGDHMAKRELIDTGSDKRYVRRNKRSQFNESDDVGRSLAADRRRRAKTKAKRGEGDKGDRPRAKTRRKAAKKSAGRKGAAGMSARKKAAKRR
jgi:hypothetical protein